MRISDWSSDVCSSDLQTKHQSAHAGIIAHAKVQRLARLLRDLPEHFADAEFFGHRAHQIMIADRDAASGQQQIAIEQRFIHRHTQLRTVIGDIVNPWRRMTAFDEPAAQQRTIGVEDRSEEHTSELQSLMRTSYAV